MKRFFSILLFIGVGKSLVFSQAKDSTKTHLSISANLIQCPINELSGYADYYLNEKSSFGINLGYIYPNPRFKVFILSNDQGTFPGTVWEGMVFRANYKHAKEKRRNRYWEVQFIYKSLGYQNQTFLNVIKDNFYYFKRNEKANLFGLDFINGRHLLKYESHVNMEIFWGIGFRYRERKYTTISSTFHYYNPIGDFVLQQFYPTIIFGFKVGFNVFLKK